VNNSELDSILKRARVPERPEEFWDSLPRQIVQRLNRKIFRAKDDRLGASFFARWGWSIATVVGMLLVLLALRWGGPKSGPDVLASPKLIDETLAMFPHRVRAIVQDDHGLRVILSEHDDVPASPPLYVRICDGGRCASAVTFSGQEVNLEGQTYAVLADVRGGIILEGSQVLWSSAEPLRGNTHLEIEAKNLGPVTM